MLRLIKVCGSQPRLEPLIAPHVWGVSDRPMATEVSMPRYFFHLTSSYDAPDDEGTELGDLDAARCHAVKLIADVLCESPGEYWKAEIYRVTVTDETRLILFTVEMMSVEAAVIAKPKA